MSLMKRCLSEFIGTFWLVLGGCGSAVLAAAYTADAAKISENTSFPLGIGLVGVSLAFGLTVLTGAYAFGHISGGHFNPAVSFGLWAGKRFPGSDLLPYIVSQAIGAVVGAGVIYLIASGKTGFTLSGSNPLATNGYGIHSPGGYTLFACFITEVVMTFMFLLIILGVTDSRAPKGFAPLAIGFGLTLIHLISIPVTNTSVNPARSTGVALFAGAELFSQVWLFWIAPILGAILAGWLYVAVFSESPVQEQQNIKELV
ncbi:MULTISPECIES: aquaporin Z [Nostoc]|uniref:Aquaporin Z n=1 Tax=Nostoc paludosum FACHB-159 TaxID=2692908 RepID=A0ABR8KAP6_9NOSO|nr:MULTISPECIES: aquaporin Z [Nostoc]MBD2682224.1 aquaporin Z [Nostoc sp. FACHB-857]MBD2736607.1 aquaporin Z [Nostoc paludosum FACHB-159]